MGDMNARFAEALLLGDISPELLSDQSIPVRRFLVPPDAIDERGRLSIETILKFGEQVRSSKDYTLLLTDRPLKMAPFDSIFGYAHRGKRLAVVSTAGLVNADQPDRLSSRLQNLSAHELGHLSGLRHCKDRRCVMRPVIDASELDQRPLVPCTTCSAAAAG